MAPRDDIPATWTARRLALARRGVLACALGLGATWVVAELVPAARAHDASALSGFVSLQRPSLDAIAADVMSLLSLRGAAAICAALVSVALVRRRPRVAVAVAAVLIASVLSADALKPLLAHAHARMAGGVTIGAASWPSGHAAAAMAIALGAVLVAPAPLRRAVAAVGALFAVAVAFSMLTLAWHMPSDIVGGFLLAGLWTSLAVWALMRAEQRWPARSGRDALARAGARASARVRHAGDVLVAVVGAVIVGAMAAIVAARGHRLVDFSDAHHAVLAAAALIAVLAASLVGALAMALRAPASG